MSGGAKRGRTADLLHAMQALYQLSYGPTREARNVKAGYVGCQGKLLWAPSRTLTIDAHSDFARPEATLPTQGPALRGVFPYPVPEGPQPQP